MGSEGTLVEFAEMAAADTCCGCGGTFSLTRYELARRINDAKVASIEATGAATLVTGCPACRMHVNDGLSRRQGSVRVLHTAQFVAVANAD
ncbi:(Fe-S)-binding protein [Solidesulfovibrio sp.]|uniref:(Fe-S)-binding protein n=1 Tax=Solidesulfovibrio sp. TaxID=2910990 RepID=UPI0034507B7A